MLVLERRARKEKARRARKRSNHSFNLYNNRFIRFITVDLAEDLGPYIVEEAFPVALVAASSVVAFPSS